MVNVMNHESSSGTCRTTKTDIEAEHVTMKVGNITIDVNAIGRGSVTLDGVKVPVKSITVELVAGLPPRITAELVAK